jgi:hypothetical protein
VKYSVTSATLVLNPTATRGGNLSFLTEFTRSST